MDYGSLWYKAHKDIKIIFIKEVSILSELNKSYLKHLYHTGFLLNFLQEGNCFSKAGYTFGTKLLQKKNFPQGGKNPPHSQLICSVPIPLLYNVVPTTYLPPEKES